MIEKYATEIKKTVTSSRQATIETGRVDRPVNFHGAVIPSF
jgi:hypothetical protein